ncbi:methyltransferase [Lentzea sp. NPDC058436]|uniref:methyltransferase n=1 Tax=Lentzea sp. NPDC058436 TaxID=3346499 RepID=UPI00364D362B
MTTTRLRTAAVARASNALRRRLRALEQRLMPPPAAMLELVTAGMLSQAVAVAAELGVADELAGGPRTASELARRLDVSEDGLSRLLRSLAARGVFAQDGRARYSLTALGRTLCSGGPTSMRAMARLFGTSEHREHWSHLLEAVRTGRPQVESVRGTDVWAYASENPEYGAIFNDAMTSMSDLAKTAIVAAYDFSPFGTVVDVGGGHGSLLATILKKNPATSGVLYDLPSVTAGAGALLRGEGVDSRCAVASGSFFDEVPAGGDAYVLKGIIHSWTDDQVREILGNVRSVIKPDGRLLLIGLIVPPGNSPHMSKVFDLEMLLVVGGRERSGPEHRRLLADAGFELTGVTRTASPMCVVEARPS